MGNYGVDYEAGYGVDFSKELRWKVPQGRCRFVKYGTNVGGEVNKEGTCLCSEVGISSVC